MDGRRILEDLTVGETNSTPEVSVSETDTIEFARRYDPQEMHTGAEDLSGGALQRVIASGMAYCRPGHEMPGVEQIRPACTGPLFSGRSDRFWRN